MLIQQIAVVATYSIIRFSIIRDCGSFLISFQCLIFRKIETIFGIKKSDFIILKKFVSITCQFVKHPRTSSTKFNIAKIIIFQCFSGNL